MGLTELTPGQYSIVYNMLSFTIATMMAAGVFFILAQHRVAAKHRISLVISTLVVGIAAYHYFRIFGSWEAAYEISESGRSYVTTGKMFNDAYRYVDWILTVPLLLVELMLVIELPKNKFRSLLPKLIIAAVLMIGLGYIGEKYPAESMFSQRGLWGFLSTIPFVYILFVLFSQLSDAMKGQNERVNIFFRNIRLLLIFTWGFYPIVYMAPFFGLTGASSLVAIQVGYTIADVLAKAAYGAMIYSIARQKSLDEGFVVK